MVGFHRCDNDISKSEGEGISSGDFWIFIWVFPQSVKDYLTPRQNLRKIR